jgi:hypothetical protein
MKSIKLSDSELTFIREHYEAELDFAQNYIVQVKEVLAKLGVSKRSLVDLSSEKEVKVGKKRGRKPGKKVVVDKPAQKKRGRKPKALPIELKPVPGTLVSKIDKKETKSALKLKEKAKAKPKSKPEKKVVEKKKKVQPAKQEIKAELKKEVKKSFKKKGAKRRNRGNVFLAPLSKPLKKKEPVVEPPVDSLPPPEIPIPQIPKELPPPEVSTPQETNE